MKMIAQVKLQLTPEQAAALRQTLERANAAANFLSDLAWRLQQFNQYNLHHAGYYSIREQFDLSAQIVVRLIAKVADAYKLDKQTKRTFKPLGAIAYDRRILTWHLDQQTVSLWALGGRIKVPFLAGERQLEMLKTYSHILSFISLSIKHIPLSLNLAIPPWCIAVDSFTLFHSFTIIHSQSLI
jgi:putative transposase